MKRLVFSIVCLAISSISFAQTNDKEILQAQIERLQSEQDSLKSWCKSHRKRKDYGSGYIPSDAKLAHPTYEVLPSEKYNEKKKELDFLEVISMSLALRDYKIAFEVLNKKDVSFDKWKKSLSGKFVYERHPETKGFKKKKLSQWLEQKILDNERISDSLKLKIEEATSQLKDLKQKDEDYYKAQEDRIKAIDKELGFLWYKIDSIGSIPRILVPEYKETTSIGSEGTVDIVFKDSVLTLKAVYKMYGNDWPVPHHYGHATLICKFYPSLELKLVSFTGNCTYAEKDMGEAERLATRYNKGKAYVDRKQAGHFLPQLKWKTSKASVAVWSNDFNKKIKDYILPKLGENLKWGYDYVTHIPTND